MIATLVIGATAAGVYFSGIFRTSNSQSSSSIQPTHPSAPSTNSETSSSETSSNSNVTIVDTQQTSQESTNQSSTSQVTNFSQLGLNICPEGAIFEPFSKQCSCDVNNNYFPMNLSGAYKTVSIGQNISCTTCASLSDQILQLGKSTKTSDLKTKTQLQSIAAANNCSPCIVFDDRINQAQQNHQWGKYFDLIVEKANDKTCGRTLTTCDSLKWQILFVKDLRAKVAKDITSTPEILESLKQKQESLTEELGNNTACYKIETLCTNLKAIYTANPATADSKKQKTTVVQSSPLIGGTAPAPTSSVTQTQIQLSTSTTQQDGTPDLNTLTLDQLFDQQYYLMHCPVEGTVLKPGGTSGTNTAPATAPAPDQAPSPTGKKVKRAQASATTKTQPENTASAPVPTEAPSSTIPSLNTPPE